MPLIDLPSSSPPATWRERAAKALVRLRRRLRGWRGMSSAPRDGRYVMLLITHGWTGEDVAVPGCWMAPNGAGKLADWWGAGAITGSQSWDGLPFKFEATAVTPHGWREFPIPSLGPQARE
jgi:hypothetical protein